MTNDTTGRALDWPRVSEALAIEIRNEWADFQAENALHPCEPPPSFIEGYRRAFERQRDAGQRVPEGWKLVPIAPTPEMRDAWEGHYDGREPERADHEEFIIRYAELLAAAPEADDERG